MSQTSSDHSAELSVLSFTGDASRNSSSSASDYNDSDGSSSRDYDTSCSPILDSLDTSACGSCNLHIRHPTCKDTSSTSPEHEMPPSFHIRNSKSRLKKQLRKKVQKSLSSSSSSNIQEILYTNKRIDLSLSSSKNSDASFSLPSPISCNSKEISAASLPATSAAAQYQPSSSLHAEDASISLKTKASVYSTEKNERKPEVDSQEHVCLQSKERKTVKIPHDDFPNPSPKVQNVKKGSEESFTASPLLRLSMQEHAMDLPQNLLDASSSLPQSENLFKFDKEWVSELPSTSSFQADEDIEAIEPFLNLPQPPSREQINSTRQGSTCSLVKSLKNDNTSTLTFQPINNSIFDEVEAVWTAPSLALPHASPANMTCTAQTSPATIKSNRGLLMKDKEGAPLCDVLFLTAKEKNPKIPQKKEANSPKRASLCSSETVFESINGGAHLEGVQTYTRNDETSSRVNVRALKVVTEVKKNVVKSAEQSMVKNIRTYYIRKIQEMETRHRKQLADVKEHLCSSGHENHSKMQDKKSGREGIVASERRPVVDYVKKSLKMKRHTMKDSCQQTEVLSVEHSLDPCSSYRTQDKAQLQELQNQIAKLTADYVLQEQLVNRLKDQLQNSTAELAKARQELSSKVSVASDSPKAQQQFNPALHQKLLRSLEASHVKSIQLQNQADNLQFENDNLKLQLSTVTCMTEGSHILAKYSHLSRKICALEQRALRREEEVQTKISEIQRKTAAENQRLQHLHEEEIREKNEKIAVLRTKLECKKDKGE